MRKKRNSTQQTQKHHLQSLQGSPETSQIMNKNLKANQNHGKKVTSCQQIKQKSIRVVNDNLISTLHPKRTSMDLNSFIQVFRKKVRQTTIAKQFQNSLQKFNSYSLNKMANAPRQKGGFVGSFKKQNQLLIQNNRIDNKIKKIIISDHEYRDRKIKTKINFSQDFLQRLTGKKQNHEESHKGQRTSKASRRRILTYSNGENQDPQNQTISFYRARIQGEQSVHNPQNLNLQFDQNFYPEKHKSNHQSSNISSLIFTNRRLETITSYQRPNLMYNLSLYRKKNSYNIIRKSQKRLSDSYKKDSLQK